MAIERPVYGMDLDATVFDWRKQMNDILLERGVITEPMPDTELYSANELAKILGDPKNPAIVKEAKSVVFEVVSSDGFFETMPLLPGAKEGITKHATAGDVLFISKPFPDVAGCEDGKKQAIELAWGNTSFGKKMVDSALIVPDKRPYLDRVHTFTDDMAPIGDVAATGLVQVKFCRPSNADVNHPFEMRDWTIHEVNRSIVLGQAVMRGVDLTQFER